MSSSSPLPHIPLGDGADFTVSWIKDNYDTFLNAITSGLESSFDGLTAVLLALPPLVMVVIFTLLAFLVRSWKFAIFTLIAMSLVVSMELWESTMETLSMVLIATIIAIIIGIPVGILAARFSTVSAIVKPILDFLQTMPSLVYLVPVVIFFSIGAPPGIVATIIFAIAPGVRLTELAIRQVDQETVEAGESFGGTPWQILRGIQLPLGLPTIMAGINQVIMLALSMIVIAGFVGAPGLGQDVVGAISRVDVALGFEAGLAVVFIAVFLDRLTAAIGQPTGSSLPNLIRRLGSKKSSQQALAA